MECRVLLGEIPATKQNRRGVGLCYVSLWFCYGLGKLLPRTKGQNHPGQQLGQRQRFPLRQGGHAGGAVWCDVFGRICTLLESVALAERKRVSRATMRFLVARQSIARFWF